MEKPYLIHDGKYLYREHDFLLDDQSFHLLDYRKLISENNCVFANNCITIKYNEKIIAYFTLFYVPWTYLFEEERRNSVKEFLNRNLVSYDYVDKYINSLKPLGLSNSDTLPVVIMRVKRCPFNDIVFIDKTWVDDNYDKQKLFMHVIDYVRKDASAASLVVDTREVDNSNIDIDKAKEAKYLNNYCSHTNKNQKFLQNIFAKSKYNQEGLAVVHSKRYEQYILSKLNKFFDINGADESFEDVYLSDEDEYDD